jgi:hypothetical protein
MHLSSHHMLDLGGFIIHSVITEDSDADDDGPGGGMLIPAQIPIQ